MYSYTYLFPKIIPTSRCVCLYVCMYVCMHVCLCIFMCVRMYVHVCMDADTHACMHACKYAVIHVYKYACMHVCTYACTYTRLHSFITRDDPKFLTTFLTEKLPRRAWLAVECFLELAIAHAIFLADGRLTSNIYMYIHII